MAKFSFSFITCLFLYMALFTYPSTSTVNCPPRLCGRKGKPTLTDHHHRIARSGGGGDDDDCHLRPPSLCWRKQQMDFIQSLTSPIASTITSMRSKIPQTKEDNVFTALALCLDHYTDAMRTFSSLRDKMKAGEKVYWLGIATSVVGDIISCHQALSNVGWCSANGVDFSGSDQVFDFMRSIIINGPSE